MGRPTIETIGFGAALAAALLPGLPQAGAAGIDGAATAGIPAAAAPTSGQAEDAALLREALTALQERQIGLALSLRDRLAPGSLDRRLLSWAIAREGGAAVPGAEIAAAAMSGWPGGMALRRNSERALFREKREPAAVVAAFGASRPQTFEGVAMLAGALVATGRSEAARDLLSPLWRKEKLDAAQETQILSGFGTLLPASDHRIRMERMLYAERIASAKLVAGAAGAAALWQAWAAVIRGQKDAVALLEAVPPAQRSAGYLFAKARWLRRAGRFDEAAALMLSAPRDGDALIDPDAWWIERRALSRELLDRGEAALAYRLADEHAAESPADAVDAEFHAGWYALRGLNDPARALRHFERVAGIAQTPIARARGLYWMGRAVEAGAPGDAAAIYRRAAAFGTAFYGQLAAAKLGRRQITLAEPLPSLEERERFMRREPVRAILRLEAAGFGRLADALYRDLGADLASSGELALLAEMAEGRGKHYLALRIVKAAANRGLEVGALTHPIGAIPAAADVSGVGRALAYAVARQESEFNIGAVSGAGARGLLQLLPGTARDAARKAGLPYSSERLTTDAAYNATLGAAFLSEQLGRFGGSYVLTFAGYNAGPGRAREWIRRYGDPRGQDVDAVVDWIERIPYAETRSYVQRVMENYQVYKMRISGRCDLGGDLVSGG